MSDKIKVTYYKPNKLRLNTNHPMFDLIREELSYFKDNSCFYNNDGIPERDYSIDKRGIFESGLLLDIKQLLKNKFDLDVDLHEKAKEDFLRTLDIPIVKIPVLDDPDSGFDERDYQIDSIKKALKMGRGIFDMGTGAGKTMCMANLLESIHKYDPDFKAMIVVPNISLKNQTYKDFKNYQCSFTYDRWMDGKIDESVNVYIVNTGFLQKDAKDGPTKYMEIKPIIQKVKYLIYDEVHKFYNKTSNKSTKLLKRINYDHMFGFSGSVWEKSFSRDRVIGFFGPVIYKVGTKELRDDGYLSEAEIKVVKFNHKAPHEIYEFNKGQNKTENYNREMEFVIDSQFRNEKTKKLVNKFSNNTLILVERIRHGEALLEELSKLPNKRVYFISGEMPVKERDRIQAEMEERDDIICIAMSVIFHVGISINNIHYIMFCYLGKAWAKVIQSIGRGLRLHESKDKLVIIDMVDNLMYSAEHARERQSIYAKQEVEFKEINIYE